MTNTELITKLKEAAAKAAEARAAEEKSNESQKENARLFLEKLRAMAARIREQQQ